jgi:cytochrome c oxidase subunit IV
MSSEALQHTPHPKEATGEGEHPNHPGPKLYAVILTLLLICTALTAGVAYIDMGIFNPIVALAIAVFKATIVVLFFMHIRYSSKLVKLTVVSGIFTFIVLITMTLSDYISRAWGLW